MQSHIHDVQSRVKHICGEITIYQETITSHARENADLSNEIEKIKIGLQVEQSKDRLLKLRSETTDNEMNLVQAQLESNK